MGTPRQSAPTTATPAMERDSYRPQKGGGTYQHTPDAPDPSNSMDTARGGPPPGDGTHSPLIAYQPPCPPPLPGGAASPGRPRPAGPPAHGHAPSHPSGPSRRPSQELTGSFVDAFPPPDPLHGPSTTPRGHHEHVPHHVTRVNTGASTPVARPGTWSAGPESPCQPRI